LAYQVAFAYISQTADLISVGFMTWYWWRLNSCFKNTQP